MDFENASVQNATIFPDLPQKIFIKVKMVGILKILNKNLYLAILRFIVNITFKNMELTFH